MKRAINFALLFVLFACASASTSIPANRYGLKVVPDVATYERLAAQDPEKRLVNLATLDIPLDIRYATGNNFMKKQLYPVAKAYLRAPAAAALKEVQQELAAKGIGIKVYDAYRPYRITEMMWEPIKNPDYVADPAKGSRHNRGAAVDLTLIDLETNRERPMPTLYDDFSERARHDFNDMAGNLLNNRLILRTTMEEHGFEPMPSEWWHYDFKGWEKFELMDVALEDLP